MTISVQTYALLDNVLINHNAEIYSTVRWDYDAGDRVYAFRLVPRKPDLTVEHISWTDLTPYEHGNVYTDHTSVPLDQLGTWQFMGDCQEWTVAAYWHGSLIYNVSCIQSTTDPEPIPQNPQPGSLGGLVYSVDGIILGGARIAASPAGGGAKAGAVVYADASGYFSMNLGEGIYDVQCSKSGYVTQTLECAVYNQATSGATFLNFIMFTSSHRFPYGFIGGFVKSQDGRFLPGASVSGAGITDQFGWFGTERVDVGTYTITASKQGYVPSSAIVTVTSGGLSKVTLTIKEDTPKIGTRIRDLSTPGSAVEGGVITISGYLEYTQADIWYPLASRKVDLSWDELSIGSLSTDPYGLFSALYQVPPGSAGMHTVKALFGGEALMGRSSATVRVRR